MQTSSVSALVYNVLMIPILLELLARLCFSGITIVNKRSRCDGASALGVMGQYIWTLPFFAALAAGLWAYDSTAFTLPVAYWRTLSLWVLICVLVNYLLMFLSRFQALTELGGYKLGFAMIVSMAIDFFWYGKSDWSFVYIAGGLIAITGSILLSQRPLTEVEAGKRIALPFPFFVLIALSMGMAALAPVGYALFKDCLLLTAHQPLAHTVIGQGILFMAFTCIGFKDYDTARKTRQITPLRTLFIITAVCIAALAQTYSVAALDVTTLMVLGLLSGAIVTGNDILTGEVAPTKYNLFSIGLVFTGSILIAVSKI